MVNFFLFVMIKFYLVEYFVFICILFVLGKFLLFIYRIFLDFCKLFKNVKNIFEILYVMVSY